MSLLPEEPPIELKYSDILKEEYPAIYDSYNDIMEEQLELFSRKMLSYGMENITMGTRLENEEEKKFSLTAIWIRCNDKMNRLKQLVVFNKDNTIEDESVVDTYMDLVNYNIIAQMVQCGLWKKGK